MTERHSMTRRGTITIGSAGRAARPVAGRAAPGWPAVVLRVAGSGLLIATAAIHLDLYLTGYRTIPTIGWLFLLQVIAAFGLGLAVLAIPRRLAAGVPARLAAAAGAGFALATLAGYLLSVWTGLFGFKEVRTGAGVAAGLVEVAAFVVLAALALAPAPATAAADGAAPPPARSHRHRHRHRLEDDDDRRDHGADQRPGPHALLLRPRHRGRIQVLR